MTQRTLLFRQQRTHTHTKYFIWLFLFNNFLIDGCNRIESLYFFSYLMTQRWGTWILHFAFRISSYRVLLGHFWDSILHHSFFHLNQKRERKNVKLCVFLMVSFSLCIFSKMLLQRRQPWRWWLSPNHTLSGFGCTTWTRRFLINTGLSSNVTQKSNNDINLLQQQQQQKPNHQCHKDGGTVSESVQYSTYELKREREEKTIREQTWTSSIRIWYEWCVALAPEYSVYYIN